MRKMFYIILFFLSIVHLSAQENIRLKFKENGKFKIAQFTDLHWIDGSVNSKKIANTIRSVLEIEKPDLVVLTGDIAWKSTSRQPWRDIPKIFEDAKIPFAVVLGNHDGEGETEITRDEIFDLLKQSPFFVGDKGPDDIDGIGNYVLPIFGQGTTIAALLYCFDSHSYSRNTIYGESDWIHFNQIEWYRKQSRYYTQQNNHIPLPALVFLHIPLPEYNEIIGAPYTIGHCGQNRDYRKVNSGLFSAFVEMQDVKGVFAGHIHNNDCIGLNFDIALAYGRMTGGSLEPGGRIIEMEEGLQKYTTWISTPQKQELFFYYPSGITSVDEDSMPYLPAKKVKPKKHGVAYTYYEMADPVKSFKDTLSAVKKVNGIMNDLSIKNATAEDRFAYDFRSYIHIPEKGVYRFYTLSDDHSQLYIDGNIVVDNRNSSGYYADGKVALEPGYHELHVLYFEDLWGQRLEVGFSDKNTETPLIPAEMLYVPNE